MLVKLFRWLNVLLIGFTVLVYLSPFVNPETFWPMAVIGPTFPWLLLFHLFFILGWLLVRKWYFVLSVLCIAVGWSHVQGVIGLHAAGPSSDASPRLKIMTYNLYMLRGMPEKGGTTRAKDYDLFSEFINQEGPLDLLCTQETSDRVSERLAKNLGFPHYQHFKGLGTSIFSKQPFLKKGMIEFGRSNNSCVWVDVDLDGKPLRIYNVHFQSNKISDDAGKLAEDIDLQERETWRGMKGIVGKYGLAARLRARQAKKVAEHVANCPHPAIIVGDFNDTSLSWSYRKLMQTGDFQDAFKVKGFGLGTTFNGVIPALRIDYTLVDQSLEIERHAIWRKPYSDHFPLFTEIRWR